MSNPQIVVLKTFESYSEAVVSCNVLNANGVEAFLSNESTSVLTSMFGAVNGVRLHVHAENVELALQILGGDKNSTTAI